VPYRSDENRRNNLQIGAGSIFSGGTPPSPIPERILDGIPGFLAWLALLISTASAIAFPRTVLLIAAIIGLYSAIRFVLAGFANFRGLRLIKEWETIDWLTYYHQHKKPDSLAWDVVHHIVIIPNYKEPMNVLRRTLDNLKNQYEAQKRLTIVLAMEAGEAECVQKAETLVAEYQACFANFFYTVHPRGLPGEMQCKSANEAWAGRWIKRHMVDELGYSIEHLCVTTQDADTRWHKNFFYALTALFATNSKRYTRFWQAPIRYHGNIWDINPLLRIVNAYATAFELAYLAAPYWKPMPMSSYSLSLKLLESSGYWDVDVIADEWHMFIKSYFAKGGEVELERMMLPFMADATIGNGVLGELKERYQQTLRHAWGSKEVGYMIAKMIDHPEVDFRRSFRLLIRISHDILLAGPGWVILTVGSQLPVLLHPDIAPPSINTTEILQNPAQNIPMVAASLTSSPAWLMIILATSIVIVLGIVFWLIDVNVRPPREKPMTISEFFWTVLSLPSLPMLTLFVVAIPTIQAQTKLLLGIPLQFRVSKKV
jgi:hypothetical protein